MVDIFERLEKNAGGPIGMYMGYAHGYFAFPKLEGEIGPHMTFRGQKMLNWSPNNYLGLANHPEVREADAKGAAEFGMAALMGARMMSGQTKYHEQLRARTGRVRRQTRRLPAELRLSGHDLDHRLPPHPARRGGL